ncbi:MAG TPA: prolyl oligopeptidase family serine peptidase [Chroococcales cyanobacterium]|jgi:prolyl oligopeptidase
MSHDTSLLPLALALCLLPAPCDAKNTGSLKRLSYPATRKVDQIDDFHGVRVADPYRWLEDLKNPEIKSWVDAENKVTFGYLKNLPHRQAIRKRLGTLWNFERYGIPFKEGGRYFFFKNDGLQNQSVLYSMPSLGQKPKLLLDPNTLSSDGTVALSDTSVSPNGRYLAYAISRSGSDWQEWRVRDINTGEDLFDRLQWIKFSSISWTHDNQGFFYSRYDEPKGDNLKEVNFFEKLCFHRIGTPQTEDRLVYERPDRKEWGFAGQVTDDGKYLVIYVSQGTENKNRFFYKDLSLPNGPVVEMLNDFDASYSLIGNDGTTFWFKTTESAPRGRVIAIDIHKPEKKNWQEVIPQKKENLEGVGLVNNSFLASYLKDAYSCVRLHRLDGSFLREMKLPGIGTAAGFGGKRAEKETFYSYTSFTTPTTIYRLDLESGRSTVFQKPRVDFDPSRYETRQFFYPSKDGTKIPMFITHKKGLKLDGKRPTYLYGYGGFNISITPAFSVSNLVWMEMGGVYAVANLRGGGEYGEDWHQAGTKLKKQNVFDDFIGAARWLFKKKYTSSSRLAIGGGSNGGLLVGACLTQRPDLFAAALPAVGVLDMLRYQKFTIGWGWAPDYGTADDPKEFKALYAYSPLHNVKKGTRYPSTMILTSDHDDRVYPAHSFKFAAALQEAQSGPAPVLIRIESKAGHGAGKPTSKQIEDASDRWAFILDALHFKPMGMK